MPDRAPVDDSLRWDLADLYRGDDDPALEEDLRAAREGAGRLSRHRGKVSALSAAELGALLVEYEALIARAWRPAIYASLRFSADTADASAQALMAHTREEGARFSTELKFIDV